MSGAKKHIRRIGMLMLLSGALACAEGHPGIDRRRKYTPADSAVAALIDDPRNQEELEIIGNQLREGFPDRAAHRIDSLLSHADFATNDEATNIDRAVLVAMADVFRQLEQYKHYNPYGINHPASKLDQARFNSLSELDRLFRQLRKASTDTPAALLVKLLSPKRVEMEAILWQISSHVAKERRSEAAGSWIAGNHADNVTKLLQELADHLSWSLGIGR